MKILLVVYDNGSYVHTFPHGTAYIAAALLKAGHDVKIYSQDYDHSPDEHLTGYLDHNKFDVVGIGVIAGYYQYKKLMALSKAINTTVNRPFFVLGGHGPSPDPDYFLRKTGADAIVIGEGEATIVELLNAVADCAPLKHIKGIAYLDGGELVVTEERGLIADVDSIPWPAFHLFPMEYYRLIREPHACNSDFVMPVLSGRGCIFNCNFCYRMDKGYRARTPQAIIDEIRHLQQNYGINYVDFSDELLMASVKRTTTLCESFLQAGLNVKWRCNGRLNFAKKDVLALMRRSGCVFINYGIESLDDQVLKNMNKQLTSCQIIDGIENTIEAGISPGLNIIFGNIGDTPETLQKGVDFLLKYDDGAQLRTIRPVTPYPGSPLYYHAIEHGLLCGCHDFYENKHGNSDLLTVNFTELTDNEFHQLLNKANSTLIENYYSGKRKYALDQCRELYLNRNVNFRGFRQT